MGPRIMNNVLNADSVWTRRPVILTVCNSNHSVESKNKSITVQTTQTRQDEMGIERRKTKQSSKIPYTNDMLRMIRQMQQKTSYRASTTVTEKQCRSVGH